jgi:hypothetical protein
MPMVSSSSVEWEPILNPCQKIRSQTGEREKAGTEARLDEDLIRSSQLNDSIILGFFVLGFTTKSLSE